MAVTRELSKAVDYFETKEILLHENPDKLENVLQNNQHVQQTDLQIWKYDRTGDITMSAWPHQGSKAINGLTEYKNSEIILI